MFACLSDAHADVSLLFVICAAAAAVKTGMPSIATKIARATEYKDAGTVAFREGNTQKAIGKYVKVRAQVEGDRRVCGIGSWHTGLHARVDACHVFRCIYTISECVHHFLRTCDDTTMHDVTHAHVPYAHVTCHT